MLQIGETFARFDGALVDLAPWALPFREALYRPQTDPAAAAGFRAARAGATLARWNAGPKAWRQWTQRIAGLEARFAHEEEAARFLGLICFADFSEQRFAWVDFGTLELPFGGSFAGAVFAGDAWFADARFRGPVDFHSAQFFSDVSFENSRFEGPADFRDAIFLKSARFISICACRSTSFRDAEFCADVWFRYSRFRSTLDFARARVGGEAGFGDCLYLGDADFSQAEFLDNAGFEQSVFAGKVSFARTSFARYARFERSSFQERPRFDGARFLGPSHFHDTIMPVAESPVAEQIRTIEHRLRRP